MKLLKLELTGEFVPSWNSNKDLPASEQVKVFFTWPTYTSQLDLQVGKITMEDETGVSDKRFLRRVIRCVSIHVTKITGLEEYKIVDGQSLVDAPTDLSGLALEIFFFIMAGQGLSDKKKEVPKPAPGLSKGSTRGRKSKTKMPLSSSEGSL